MSPNGFRFVELSPVSQATWDIPRNPSKDERAAALEAIAFDMYLNGDLPEMPRVVGNKVFMGRERVVACDGVKLQLSRSA